MIQHPTAWWEFLFAPIMIPLLLLILLLIGVVSIPLAFIHGQRQLRKERQLRSRLIAAGRFIEWSEIKVRWKAGDGTLIVEWFTFIDAPRYWWTEVDLIGAAPFHLPVSSNSLPEGEELERLQAFAKTCLLRYVDIQIGIAKLTNREWTGTPASEKYPRSKVVSLCAWTGHEPLVFVGDQV
jgi:hypothetical protein